ncbi:MAG: tRNA 4-thiouridine(8) synthase ThiI [Clostridia bacterium]|nr:tRNA 4-thiouridine(8) synthase ThiI [Clostridia bacterium]
MEKVILVRFSEIHLKGKNKSYFLKLLHTNIKRAVKEFECVVEKIQNRILIKEYNIKDEDEIIAEIKKVFGVYSLSVAVEIDSNYETIKDYISKLEVVGSFKVDCNRADKTFPIRSNEMDCNMGEIILNNNKDAKVDVKNPETVVKIDIRENGKTYIFDKIIYTYGGMPLGEHREGLVLLSGGIDSPVAGFQMAKRGLRQDILHFDSYPYTSPMAREKVITLAKKIKNYIGCRYMFIISMTTIQEEFHQHCKDEYAITLLRRAMVKIAEKICLDKGYKAIVTGESLGQVASQTIESITCTNNSTEIIPILRPLISFNKDEIIKVAQEIDTYETSILPYEDCCTVFLPQNPVIKPKIAIAQNEEKRINLEELINKAIENMIVIEL